MNFEPGQIYHIYNRGNNSQTIFFQKKNYDFFLQKIKLHLLPYSVILAYCLIPNHFHILLSKKGDIKPKSLNDEIAIMLRSYTRAINIQEDRTGSLFQQKTKAKNVNEYGLICMNYIHQNPYRAGLVKKLEDWEYSSFQEYFSEIEDTICNCELALDLFRLNDKDEFYRLSNESISEDTIGKIED